MSRRTFVSSVHRRRAPSDAANRPRWTARTCALSMAVLGAALALAPSQAGAAQRVETIDVPSLKGHVDLAQSRLNRPATKLQANVVLPDGYDRQPDRRWPVLFLLAGVGDNMTAWLDTSKGNALPALKGFAGIVVMPESGRGYFTDWWRGGTRVGSSWERYYLEEVIPAIESRYRTAPGRANRAIGGISMGGYGGMTLAAALPSYFGTAFSLSGLLDLQAWSTVNVVPLDIGSPYTRLWGPATGPYATVRNPVNLGAELRHTRLYVYTGNGTPSARYPFNFSAYTSGAIAEQEVRNQSMRFSNRVRAAGGSVTYSTHTGVHDWPYWRSELRSLLRWGVFGTPPVTDPAAAQDWTYSTMAGRGNAWGIGYAMDRLPRSIVTLKRSGQQLSGTGVGTVTITPGAADADASGAGSKTACSFTTTLPFTRTLPADC